MPMISTVMEFSGVVAGSTSDAAVQGRADVFEMTKAAEDAVLRPADTGPWSHALRAAMASRIAALHEEAELSSHFAEHAGEFAALTETNNDGAAFGLSEVMTFMDKVASDTRNVTADHVSDLQGAGVADADIVRLAELNAFVAYQVRLIGGLRLMQGVFA